MHKDVLIVSTFTSSSSSWRAASDGSLCLWSSHPPATGPQITASGPGAYSSMSVVVRSVLFQMKTMTEEPVCVRVVSL